MTTSAATDIYSTHALKHFTDVGKVCLGNRNILKLLNRTCFVVNICTDGVCLCDVTHPGDGEVVSSVANLLNFVASFGNFSDYPSNF